MNEQLFLSKQNKERLSFFYDKNWRPFQQFIRKRFRISSSFMRKIYEESFCQLIEQVRTNSVITIPLKIALYRIATEKVLHSSAIGRKELPDISAFQAEWQEQERYIQIYQRVKAWFEGEEEKQSDEEKYACIREIAEMGNIAWPNLRHEEELKRQKDIEHYLFGELPSRERFGLEKNLCRDEAYQRQYDAIALFTDTADNVVDDEELKEISKNWQTESIQSLFKEKRNNRRFLWQAALVALILFLLNLLMKAFY